MCIRDSAGIVELAGLPDDDRAGADDEDRFDVGSFGHSLAFSIRHSGTARQRRTRNPEAGTVLVSGFRVRTFGAPRNDEISRHKKRARLCALPRTALSMEPRARAVFR